MSWLSVKQLHLQVDTPEGVLHPVEGVSFELGLGETLGLVGESGCGKSLTAASILRLLPPGFEVVTGSEIKVDGQDCLRLPEKDMHHLRGSVLGYIPQDPMSALNPVLTIGTQLIETLSHDHSRTKPEKIAIILHTLNEVGLPDSEALLKKYPFECSGGMRQRVVIAQALLKEPKLLVADEPTTALDVTLQAQIVQLLKSLTEARGMGLLFISHDLALVNALCDKVLVMYAGYCIESGLTQTVFSEPMHPYTQALLAASPTLNPNQPRLNSLGGAVPKRIHNDSRCRFLNRCEARQSACQSKSPPIQGTDHQVRCLLPIASLTTLPTTQRMPGADKPSTAKAESSEPLLSCQALSVSYPIRTLLPWQKKQFEAAKLVNLRVNRGETIAIVGESGSGKSSLCKGILGLADTTYKQFRFQAQARNQLLPSDAQMIFQDPFESLNPKWRIEKILAEALGVFSTPDTKPLSQVLTAVGLDETALGRYPHEFSGGQRQRIAIARALLKCPQLLILDEPTSALDVSVQAQILNLLKALQSDTQMSYLLVTHDMGVVAYMADHVLVMHQGEVVESGTVQSVLESPEHPYTQTLLDAVPQQNRLKKVEVV